MAARWIENRSFKRITLPECSSVGYLADLVSIAGLEDAYHARYAKHNGLEQMYMVPDPENPENRIIGGDIDRWFICVFEVKVQRSDFLNTFGNKDSVHAKARLKPVGTAHWVVAEKGVCRPEELPDFWGLLEPYGTGLTEKKMPVLNVLPDSIIHSIGFDMMWLEKNYRRSFWEKGVAMQKAIEALRAAIVREKPREELLKLSNDAINVFKGR
jgi:hypothetical protein